MNADLRFTRVRIRERVLPMLEAELGPGIAEALARTAELLREHVAVLDEVVREEIQAMQVQVADDRIETPPLRAGRGHSLGTGTGTGTGHALGVGPLASLPSAARAQAIREAARDAFGASLTRERTLEVARLVTDWHGQGPIDLPGGRVVRDGDVLRFRAD